MVRDDDGIGRGEKLDALRAWLLTEDSYSRGEVPDEVLTYMQDHISRLLGPQALQVAGDFLRQHVGHEGDLAELARRRPALLDLLKLAETKRRRSFEPERHAAHSPLQASKARRPMALLVMAEHNVGDPVGDRPLGTGEPVSLSELGVPDSLVRRLRAWNERFERLALTDFEWESPDAHSAWAQQGLLLAHELQRELPDMDIRYFHADEDRPLRSL